MNKTAHFIQVTIFLTPLSRLKTIEKMLEYEVSVKWWETIQYQKARKLSKRLIKGSYWSTSTLSHSFAKVFVMQLGRRMGSRLQLPKQLLKINWEVIFASKNVGSYWWKKVCWQREWSQKAQWYNSLCVCHQRNYSKQGSIQCSFK